MSRYLCTLAIFTKDGQPMFTVVLTPSSLQGVRSKEDWDTLQDQARDEAGNGYKDAQMVAFSKAEETL